MTRGFVAPGEKPPARPPVMPFFSGANRPPDKRGRPPRLIIGKPYTPPDGMDGDADMEPDSDDEDGGGEELHRSGDTLPGDAGDAERNGDEHEPGELREV